MTPFGLLLTLSGLSQREAAAFLRLSPTSIDKMSRGHRAAPPGVLAEMCALIARQQAAADEALDIIEEARPPEVEIGFPADDHEANVLGWPCVSAWQAMAARVVAEASVPVRLVPRGSTVGTARAADEHGA